MCLKLKEGAIFIADAHYPNHKAQEFLKFLNDIKNKQIIAPQLFLVGDIFDLLVGNSSYLKDKFKFEILLLDEIAKNIEVIYLEGNHDFYLKPLFKNIKIISLQNQPLMLKNGNKTYAISHGDKYCVSFSYKIYTKIIRNPAVLKILPEFIAKKKLKDLSFKKICKKMPDFKSRVEEILKNYNSDTVIEGHYHQEKIIKNYISLPSFGCTQKIAVFKNNRFEFFKV